jgi:hypothetical protein
MRRLIVPLTLLALTVACGETGTEPRRPSAPKLDVFEVQFDRVGADSARFTVYVKATDPDGPDDKVTASLYPGELYGEWEPAYEIPWRNPHGFSPHADTVVAILPDVETEIVQKVRLRDEEGTPSDSNGEFFLTLPPRG